MGALVVVVVCAVGLVAPATGSAGKSPEQRLSSTFQQFSGQLSEQNIAIRRLTAAKPTDLLEWIRDPEKVFSLATRMERTAKKARQAMKRQTGLNAKGKKARRVADLTFRRAEAYAVLWSRMAETLDEYLQRLGDDFDGDGVPFLDDPDELAEVNEDVSWAAAGLEKRAKKIRKLWLLANQLMQKAAGSRRPPTKPKIIRRSTNPRTPPQGTPVCTPTSQERTLECALPQPEGGAWQGRWSTPYGDMVITQSGSAVSGCYERENSTITNAVASGNTLSGTWMNRENLHASNPDLDTGSFTWTLSGDGKSFSGSWTYRESTSGGGWTGSKLSDSPTPACPA